MTLSAKLSVRRSPLFWPLIAIAALLVVRVITVFQHPFDSDEGQHLHLVYGWLAGELPYRDRFDNHTPLLYLLYLPLAALAGETPHIVLLARLAIFPVSAAMLGLIYLVARRLADREIALWTVATTLALADWSTKSLEFRPDVLWAALWFVTLWLLIRRAERPGAGDFFLAGVALGAALCASIKTTFLAPALFVGWTGAWLLSLEFRAAYPGRKLARLLPAAAAGFAVVPAAVFGGLLAAGTTFERLRFCLFDANRAPFEPARVAFCLILALLACAVAWRMVRRRPWRDAVAGAVFLSAAAYATALVGFSPELRKQTFLPVYPLLIFFGWRTVAAAMRPRWAGWIPALGAIVVAAGTAHLLVESPPWRDGLRAHRELLRDTLALTRPGDSLLDLKGETIFRRRPVFLVYQHATVRGINEGRLAEPDPRLLADRKTAVVVGGKAGFTRGMKDYLKARYVPAGRGNLRVAGESLKPSWREGRWVAAAEIPVAGDYVFLRNGEVIGEFRAASAGPVTLDFGDDREPRLLYWKPAWEAGYPPRVK